LELDLERRSLRKAVSDPIIPAESRRKG